MTPLTPEELQRAVRKVVADYEAFVSRGPAPGMHEDPKAFTAHHAAARSALAHLEHLMKLNKGQAETDAVTEAGALIAEARRSIQLAEQEDREGEESAEDEEAA
ncbi:hypothetical protein SAMN02745194_03511 [Roseomonas rosea]|uniref:Uncharacterized protein n=1 Tax=Muricoccus roseus TaxID=198092 RepID=A0A1M6ML04_9PROT|nr:hypothetical protein [Roseomonas rosea]SHJ84132.1 hypothetical protein SAMN02745194_03511 [Roseomonas rosea]